MWDELQRLSFEQLWSPGAITLTIIIGIAYFALIGPFRDRFANSTPVSTKQKVLFVTGLVIFYIGQGSPINILGHRYMFSFHMLQQSLDYLFAPPLLLLGLPAWFFRALLSPEKLKKFFAKLLHPLFCIALFNMLFSFYHLPLIFDYVMDHSLARVVVHTVLFITALHMWWPIICPLPEWNRLSGIQKMVYIFADGVIITPACALIMFANTIIYTNYVGAPLLIDILPPQDDQQLGGVLMKVMQEISYGTALIFVFFKWHKSERAKEKDNEAAENERYLAARAAYLKRA